MFNSKVVRSTMGGIFRMPFVYVEDFKKAIYEIKERTLLYMQVFTSKTTMMRLVIQEGVPS